MNLKSETILDYYTYKNDKIFCQINVLSKKNHKLQNTCRSITSEQWNSFDRELERLLDNMKALENADKENLGQFFIRPNIKVKVQKSKLYPTYFRKWFSPTNCDSIKDLWGATENNAFALECVLDLEHEAIPDSSKESQEYEPKLRTASPDGKVSNTLTYKPYTPSKTKYYADDRDTIKTSGIELLNYNEDTYSPRPLFEVTSIPSLDEKIPKYKPAPIKGNEKSKDGRHDDIVGADNDAFAQKSKEEYIPEAQKLSISDIPAYVPTPIDSSPTRKASFDNKRLRRRSKTVDTMPKHLSSSIFGNRKLNISATKPVGPLNDNIPKYKPTYINEICISTDGNSSLDNKSENEVIIETDIETVPLQYRPIRRKSKNKVRYEEEKNTKSKIDEHLTKEDTATYTPNENYNINTSEVIKGIDESPEILSQSYKKNSKERSKTIDSIPKELVDEKFIISRILEQYKTTAKSKTHKSKEIQNETSIPINEREKSSVDKSAIVLHPNSSSEDENGPVQPKRLKKQTESPTNESDNDFEDPAKASKKKNFNSSTLSSSELITSDVSPKKSVRKSKRPEQSYTSITSLRRSDRSPSKPKRFIDEIKIVDSNHNKKPKKLKTSTKNKELFGTDDDDDDDAFEYNSNNSNNDKETKTTKTIFDTPIGKIPNKYPSSPSSSSSAKKKHKTDKSNDCEQEKRDISKWLSKKKTSSLDPEATTSKISKKLPRSNSPSTKSSKMSKSSKKLTESKQICSDSVTLTSENFDMPSMKELEEMRNKTKLKQKENEILKAELDKMSVPPPRAVENLSLQDMSLHDILDTFSTYKNELDEIYKKNCKKDYIKGHDGINHCFVIQLLQPNIQMKMLEKLTEVYSTSNNKLQATLYANALLPEWVIRVYMKKFKFSRQEAIYQIKAQDDYRLYIEEQNDGSFLFH